MASHLNTPSSVLRAPSRTHSMFWATDGPSREERRHFRLKSEGNPETPPKLRFKPMLVNYSNTPYVRSIPKIRGGRHKKFVRFDLHSTPTGGLHG